MKLRNIARVTLNIIILAGTAFGMFALGYIMYRDFWWMPIVFFGGATIIALLTWLAFGHGGDDD